MAHPEVLGEVVSGVVGHEGGDDDHVELAGGLGDLGGEGLEGAVVGLDGELDHLAEGRFRGFALREIKLWENGPLLRINSEPNL